MLLISPFEPRIFEDREDIDQEAYSVVIEAYQKGSIGKSPTAACETAVEAYRQKFPHIPKNIASQAVACILATKNL